LLQFCDNADGWYQALICFVAIAVWSGIANAQNAVYIGSDEFTTGTGTFVTFPFPTGLVTVQLKGKPLKGTKTDDTRVERTQIARFKTTGTDAGTATISILLTALSLTGNVTVGTTPSTADIALDPNNLANDTGSMTLTVTPNSNPVSGTFMSTLNVYYEATFLPAACSVTGPIFGSYTMVQQGGTWSSVPPAGAYLTVAAAANCVPTNPPTAGPVGISAEAVQHCFVASRIQLVYNPRAPWATPAGSPVEIACGIANYTGGGVRAPQRWTPEIVQCNFTGCLRLRWHYLNGG